MPRTDENDTGSDCLFPSHLHGNPIRIPLSAFHDLLHSVHRCSTSDFPLRQQESDYGDSEL